jgi:hypothetical protein
MCGRSRRGNGRRRQARGCRRHPIPRWRQGCCSQAPPRSPSPGVSCARRAVTRPLTLCIGTGLVLLGGAFAAEIAGQWRAGWRPDQSGYAALVGMNVVLQGQLVVAVAVMSLFAVARRWAGHLNVRRRAVFDNVRLLWLYAVAQSLLGLLLVHGFPRAV